MEQFNQLDILVNNTERMITLVNVFTVNSNQQQDAFQAIQKVYTQVVQYQPGFITAQLLCSDDGTRVTAFAQWKDENSLAALQQNPKFQELHDAAFFGAIESLNGHVYSSVTAIEAAHKDSGLVY
jgi:quinol monooxygenase YgiN